MNPRLSKTLTAPSAFSFNITDSTLLQIVALDDRMQSMMLTQQQLEHELDFIKGQQRELEDALDVLEKQGLETPTNSDPEREQVYVHAYLSISTLFNI